MQRAAPAPSIPWPLLGLISPLQQVRQQPFQLMGDGAAVAPSQAVDLLGDIPHIQSGPVLVPQGRGLRLRPRIEIAVIPNVGHALSLPRWGPIRIYSIFSSNQTPTQLMEP